MRTHHHPVHHMAPAQVFPAVPPPAAGQPAQAPASAQTHSQFHQQRAGVLRQMPRPMPHVQAQGATRNRTAQQARSAAEPENALFGAIANTEQSGSGDDERMPDDLARDLLRRAARQDDQLEPDGVAGLRHQEASGARPDDGALGELRERLGGGAEIGGASALDDALALAGRMTTHGEGSLTARVALLRRSAGQDPAMRRQDADGVQVWIAQRQAASLHLLASCLEQGATLHAQLRGNGLLVSGSDKGPPAAERAGLGLLEAGRAANGSALVKRIGARDGKGRDGRTASQLLGAALRTLPDAIWPSREGRSKLLHELDLAAAEDTATPGAAARTERQLRASQEHRHA